MERLKRTKIQSEPEPVREEHSSRKGNRKARREQRKRAQAAAEYAAMSEPRTYHHLCIIKVPLSYRSKTSNTEHKESVRWYAVGAEAIVAFVEIFQTGTIKAGNVCVHMSANQGNGGKWFENVKAAEEWIISELERRT